MSNMKCPFCGKKLWYDEQDDIYRCMKSACVMDYEGGTEKLWQAFIQSQKDLEKSKERYSVLKKKVLDWQMEAIVRNAELKIARNALEELRGDKRLPPQTPWEIIADKALKQIEQKEEHDGIPL